MHKRIAALLVGLSASGVNADVVEVAPDLYLAVRQSRVENEMEIKLGAIKEAHRFAADNGRVAVPIAGQAGVLGPLLKMYEYQFRLMTRDEALAARPILSEAVLHVAGQASCMPEAGSALVHDLQTDPVLARLDPLRRLPPPAEQPMPAAEEPEPLPEVQPPPSIPETPPAGSAN